LGLRSAAIGVGAASLARANDCDGMKKSIQVLIDKIEDKAGDKTSRRCVTASQMIGLLKNFRWVLEECLSGDDRFRQMARGDVVIRNLQGELDNLCR